MDNDPGILKYVYDEVGPREVEGHPEFLKVANFGDKVFVAISSVSGVAAFQLTIEEADRISRVLSSKV